MEHMKKLYHKEEEFIDEFGNIVSVAVGTLNGEWQPNYTANDGIRENQEYFFSIGELEDLVFDSACVYHDDNRFSST